LRRCPIAGASRRERSSLSPRGMKARCRSCVPRHRAVRVSPCGGHVAAGIAPCNQPDGMHPVGGRPDRSHGSLAFATALHGLGTLTRPGPRGTFDRSAVHHFHGGLRDPPDLRAVLSDTSRSLRPDDSHRRVSSPGVVQRSAPPSTSTEESTPSRFRGLRRGLPHPLAFRPRGFAPPRRLAPLRSRGLVSSRCRPWGSSRFHRSRNRLPRHAIRPFEAFPPPTARSMSPSRLPSRPSPSALAGAEPQGVAPSSGPLLCTPFPVCRARCSLGLGWSPLRPSSSVSPRPRRAWTARRTRPKRSSCTFKESEPHRRSEEA